MFDYLIIAGGLVPNAKYLKKLLKLTKNVVTIDGGGATALKLRVKPYLHVGDGDSFSKKNLLKLAPKALVELNPNKKFSDLEYALKSLDPSKVKIVIGAHQDHEGRPDHSFVNLVLLSTSKNIFFVDEGNWITPIIPHHEFSFKAPRSSLFSTVLVSPYKNKITICGAKYNMKNKPFEYASQGLSNLAGSSKVTIKSQGLGLLFVHSDITHCKIDL